MPQIIKVELMVCVKNAMMTAIVAEGGLSDES